MCYGSTNWRIHRDGDLLWSAGEILSSDGFTQDYLEKHKESSTSTATLSVNNTSCCQLYPGSFTGRLTKRQTRVAKPHFRMSKQRGTRAGMWTNDFMIHTTNAAHCSAAAGQWSSPTQPRICELRWNKPFKAGIPELVDLTTAEGTAINHGSRTLDILLSALHRLLQAVLGGKRGTTLVLNQTAST